MHLELHLSLHILAARAYYLSPSHDTDNLDRAEAALNELIDTIDSATDRVSTMVVLGGQPSIHTDDFQRKTRSTSSSGG